MGIYGELCDLESFYEQFDPPNACFVNYTLISHLLFTHVFLHVHFSVFVSHHKTGRASAYQLS